MPNVFSFSPQLPSFVLFGRVRDDLAHATSSQALSAAVRDGSAVGREIVIELQIDPAQCSWPRPNESTTWCLVRGHITRADVGEFSAPSVVVEDVAVTTDTVPCELEAQHRALVEEDADGGWILKMLKSMGRSDVTPSEQQPPRRP